MTSKPSASEAVSQILMLSCVLFLLSPLILQGILSAVSDNSITPSLLTSSSYSSTYSSSSDLFITFSIIPSSRQTTGPTIVIDENFTIRCGGQLTLGFSDIGSPPEEAMLWNWSFENVTGPVSVRIVQSSFSLEIRAGETPGNGSFELKAKDSAGRTASRAVFVTVFYDSEHHHKDMSSTPFLKYFLLIMLFVFILTTLFLLVFAFFNNRLSETEIERIEREREMRASASKEPKYSYEEPVYKLPQSANIKTRFMQDNKGHPLPPPGVEPYVPGQLNLHKREEQRKRKEEKVEPVGADRIVGADRPPSAPSPVYPNIHPTPLSSSSTSGHSQNIASPFSSPQTRADASPSAHDTSASPVPPPATSHPVPSPAPLVSSPVSQSPVSTSYDDPEKKELDLKLHICKSQIKTLSRSGKDTRHISGVIQLVENYYNAKNYKKALKHLRDAEEMILKLRNQ
ncbi:MAG: hypothetical protein QW728_07740 [Thermoplasmata archaeon]